MSKPEKPIVKWHQLFAYLLELLLTPHGITVETEVEVSGLPPKTDIVLIQNDAVWTEAQRQHLADGLRESTAQRLLIEFKATESLDEDAMRQIFVYDTLYRQKCAADKLTVDSFLVVSISSTTDILSRFGYISTQQAGVYRSRYPVYNTIPVVMLNELANSPHNAFFKLFASRRQAKRQAVQGIRRWWWQDASKAVRLYVQTLLDFWLKGVTLMEVITPEILMKQSRDVKELFLPLLEMADFEAALEETEYIQKVRQNTEAQTLRHTIAQALNFRFAVSLSEYEAKLASLPLNDLHTLNEAVFHVHDLAEFETKRQGLQAEASR